MSFSSVARLSPGTWTANIIIMNHFCTQALRRQVLMSKMFMNLILLKFVNLRPYLQIWSILKQSSIIPISWLFSMRCWAKYEFCLCVLGSGRYSLNLTGEGQPVCTIYKLLKSLQQTLYTLFSVQWLKLLTMVQILL